MPTYDYKCTACGNRFELFESINATGSKACPKCNKKKAKRMLGTGAGLIFKGAGFYTTDSKGSSGGGSGSSGGSDKKSEPKDKAKKEEKEPKK
jgi:putative FmdB family regulatory protein